MDEIKIIEIIKKTLKFSNKNVVKGIDDDCAVIKIDENFYLVATTDMMVKKTHIPSILTPYEIGRRILTANISDIASMGAKPLAFLLSISLSKEEANELFIKELYSGLDEFSKLYNCPVVGGDTNKGDELILSGTALGITDNPIYRRGEVGDDICVTNDLGRVYCALHLYYKLKYKKISYKEFEKLCQKYPKIFEKLKRPVARVKEGLLMNKLINGCCDISDGLGKEITYFKNFEIHTDKIFKLIPEDVVEFCEAFDLNPIKVALNSGEEFELLFTTSKFNKVKNTLKNYSKVHKIGKIIEEGQFIDGEEFHGGGYIHKW
ncbi:thiamine-phosphate kinase [Methanocaldococcus fervens]|uniref:Thiamine-monophosphate kinase n=1 Tax=Methanocaldococcus fervens (strain DSM 4213 / JCM 15782 / AG86) TaxID=573064 RepID=C7P921_METFA|nr:thiamine-phosphate kinase [Methanocaldococcus fervens]ACV25053.1 thiamine-monophosphate kinase [Methanocaldococcus fervens AG86]